MVSSFNGGSGSFAGRTIAVSTRVLPLGRSGAVAQLRTDLRGALTWSKVSGPASVAVSSSGDVTLSSAIAEGAQVTFRVRVQNAAGDAFERDVTLQTQASLVPVTGPTTPPVVTPTPTPSIAFSDAAVSIAEGNAGSKTVSNTLTVTRNGVTGPLTINLAYTGSASNGADYTAPVSGIIASGSSTLQFDVVINGDTAVEADETIIVDAALAGYSAAARRTITVTNDDVTVTPPTGATMTVFAGAPAGTVIGPFTGSIGTPRYGDRPTANGSTPVELFTASGGNLLVGSDF